MIAHDTEVFDIDRVLSILNLSWGQLGLVFVGTSPKRLIRVMTFRLLLHLVHLLKFLFEIDNLLSLLLALLFVNVS